jgi:protease YdgD
MHTSIIAFPLSATGIRSIPSGRPWPRCRQKTVKTGLAIFGILATLQPVPARGLPDSQALERLSPVTVTTPPFDALVRVQTELGERCTGFLITPTLVMTAAHCLYLDRVRHYVQTAYRLGLYRAHSAVIAFRIPAAYRPSDEAATAGADRAILVLQRPVGNPSQILPLGLLPVITAPIRLAGYRQDHEELAVETDGCRVLGTSADGEGRPLLSHDCQATPGTSGAPLVWRGPDGRWVAIGVQIETSPRGKGGLAVPTLDASRPDRSVDR